MSAEARSPEYSLTASGKPVRLRRDSTRTVSPAARCRSASARPMNPIPPVIAISMERNRCQLGRLRNMRRGRPLLRGVLACLCHLPRFRALRAVPNMLVETPATFSENGVKILLRAFEVSLGHRLHPQRVLQHLLNLGG